MFCVALATATAVGAPSEQLVTRSLVVPVGEQVATDVDYKMGYACDDPSILRASLITRNGRNWFIVEGVTPGRTWCRVGTDPSFPSYLFDVTVVRPRPLPPRWRPR